MRPNKLSIYKIVFLPALLIACTITSFSQGDPVGTFPGDPPAGSCNYSGTTFTPILGIGTNTKIVLGGLNGDDGSINWNAYNDNGISKAFNMPTMAYPLGIPINTWSSQIRMDLNTNIWRFRTGMAPCNGPIAWRNTFNIFPDGKVSIGTDNTYGYTFAVNGSILCKTEFRVNQISFPWPDYVFKRSYTLRPLLMLERDILSLGRLPNMPSAAEVEKDGVDLVKMNAALLEKVEELTLYSIDLQKQILELKQKVDEINCQE